MKKKIVSILSAAVLMMLALPSAMAENTAAAAPQTVLYENDFNAGSLTTAFKSFENEYLKLPGYATDGTKEYESDAIGYANGAITTGQGRGVNGRTILLDFTKGGTKTGISEGKVVIGYDITLRTTADSYAQSYAGMNMGSCWDGGRMVYFDYNGFDAKATIGDWPESATMLVNDGKEHRYETLFDFAEGKAYLYMDGVMVHTWTNLFGGYATMNNYSIALNGDIARFDNLKVAVINPDSEYTFKANDTYNSKGYAEVVFEAAMNTTAEGSSFVVDGSPAEKVEWAGLSIAKVYSENLKNLGEHTIIVEGAQDMYGVAPKNTQTTVNVTPWDGEYILYEATFDNGATGLYWEADNDFFTGGYNATKNEGAEFPIGGKTANTFAYGANNGIGYEPNWWAKGQTFWFDFTKGGTKEAPRSGRVKFSMDFMLQEAPTDTEGSSFIKNNGNNSPTSGWSFAGFIYKDGKPYIVTWDASGSNYIIFTDLTKYGDVLDYEMHTLDMYLDFGSEGRVTTYIDGVQMPRVFNYWTTINQFGFAMSGIMKYVDNVKLSYIKDGSFGVESLKAPQAGDNTLTLYTTEQAAELTPSSVTVTKNGTAVAPSGVEVKTAPSSISNDTRYVVEITLPEAVVEGAEYEVTLGSTVTSVKGYKVNASASSAKATAEAVVAPVTGITVANGKATAVIVNNG